MQDIESCFLKAEVLNLSATFLECKILMQKTWDVNATVRNVRLAAQRNLIIDWFGMLYIGSNCWNTLWQRFSIPATPPMILGACHRFRHLFHSNISEWGSGHHRIFHHDSIQRERIYSIQRSLKCTRCEFKLYLITDAFVTRHTSLVSLVCVWRRWHSANMWMNVPKK